MYITLQNLSLRLSTYNNNQVQTQLWKIGLQHLHNRIGHQARQSRRSAEKLSIGLILVWAQQAYVNWRNQKCTDLRTQDGNIFSWLTICYSDNLWGLCMAYLPTLSVFQTWNEMCKTRQRSPFSNHDLKTADLERKGVRTSRNLCSALWALVTMVMKTWVLYRGRKSSWPAEQQLGLLGTELRSRRKRFTLPYKFLTRVCVCVCVCVRARQFLPA